MIYVKSDICSMLSCCRIAYILTPPTPIIRFKKNRNTFTTKAVPTRDSQFWGALSDPIDPDILFPENNEISATC